MFQFARFASFSYVFRKWYRIMRWVAPFGNPRIKACWRLPVAYRSLPRPSSPLSAKASTKCPSFTSFVRRKQKIYPSPFKIWGHWTSGFALLTYFMYAARDSPLVRLFRFWNPLGIELEKSKWCFPNPEEKTNFHSDFPFFPCVFSTRQKQKK